MARHDGDTAPTAEMLDNFNGDDKSQGDPTPEVQYEVKEPSDGEEAEEELEVAEEGEEQSEEGDEQQEEAEKPKKTAKGRIDELTKARREAERERDYWRDKARSAAQSATPVGKAVDAPDPAKFDYGEADPAYIRELTRFEAKKALDEERQERAQSDHNQAMQGAANALIGKGRLNYADFDQKVLEGASKGTWDCSQELALELIDSDHGDAIAYHLASNPAEARRLSALPSRSLAREIGKLELTLAEAPVVKPKVVSDAPPPPKRSAKGNVRSGGFDVENSSFEDFEKWASKQMNRRR